MKSFALGGGGAIAPAPLYLYGPGSLEQQCHVICYNNPRLTAGKI